MFDTVKQNCFQNSRNGLDPDILGFTGTVLVNLITKLGKGCLLVQWLNFNTLEEG